MKVLYIFLCAALLHSSQSQLFGRFSWGRQTTTEAPPQTNTIEDNVVGLIQNTAAAAQAVVEGTANANLAGLKTASIVGSIGAGAASAVKETLAVGAAAGNALSTTSSLASSGTGIVSSIGQSLAGSAGGLALNAVSSITGINENILRFVAWIVKMFATLEIDAISGLATLSTASVQAPRLMLNLMEELISNSPLGDLMRDPRIGNLLSGLHNTLTHINDPLKMALAIKDVLLQDLSLLPEIPSRVTAAARTISSTLTVTFGDIVQGIKNAIQQLNDAVAVIKEQFKNAVTLGLQKFKELIKARVEELLKLLDYAIENAQSLTTPEQVQALMGEIQSRINMNLDDVQIEVTNIVGNAGKQAIASLTSQMAAVENIANTLKEKASAIGNQNIVTFIDETISLAKTKLENLLAGTIQQLNAALPNVLEQIQNLHDHEINLVNAAIQLASQNMDRAISSGGPQEVIKILQDLKEKIQSIFEGRADIKELVFAPLRSAESLFEGQLKAIFDYILNSATSLLLPSIDVNISVNA